MRGFGWSGTRRELSRVRGLARVSGLSRRATVLAVGAAIAAGAMVAPVTRPAAAAQPTRAPLRAASGVVTEHVDLAAPTGFRISGTITAAGGGPVAGATVTACPPTAYTDGAECKGAPTSAAGAYTITGLAPGRYTVRVAPSGDAGTTVAAGYRGPSGYVATRAASSAVVVGSSDLSGVDVILPAGRRITGVVAGVGGRSTSDSFVEACATSVPAGIECTGVYASLDGSFDIGGLGAGSYVVSVQVPASSGLGSGYYSSSGFSVARAGATVVTAGTTGIQIRLPLGKRISGKVSLEGYGPAGWGEVIVQACPDTECFLGPAARTTEDGGYTIEGVAPGSYVVSFSRPIEPSWAGGYRGDGGYVAARTSAAHIAVGSASVYGVDATLPQAGYRITGRATGDGSPVRGGVIVACGPGGICAWTRTASDGSYALALVSAGPWTVALRAPGLWAVGLPPLYTGGAVLPRDSGAMDGYAGAGGFTVDAGNAVPVTVGEPDTTRPAVVSRAPRPGATGVARSMGVTVVFSEPVTGVSARTFVLRDASTRRLVPAAVTYDAATRTAVLQPKAKLGSARRYQASLAPGVLDLALNPLTPVSWVFTTRR